MTILRAVMMFALSGQITTTHPVRSAAVAGPQGLEGWTIRYDVKTLEDQGPLPMKLVIARHGRVVRRIDGVPFVWRWRFQSGGDLVAYETGPLHFGMTCVLANVGTGKRLASFDCFRELPADAPAWVRELESGSP